MAKGNTRRSSVETVSRGVAILGACLSLAVGFFLGFTVHGMMGGDKAPATPPTAQTATAPATNAGPVVSGPLAERIQAMERQVQLEPNNPTAWSTLGNLYFDTKQPQKAITAYEKSLTLNPQQPNVLTDQGVMYRQLGEFDKALASFDKAITIDPTHVIAHYNKSIVLEHDKHDKAGALAALKTLAAQNPNAVLPGGRPVSQAIQEMEAQP